MQNPFPSVRSRPARIRAGRISALALLAGLGAGCSSDAVRLNEPIITGSTPNQQRIITAQAGAAPAAEMPAVPTQPVVAQPLSPVGQQQVAFTGEAGAVDAPTPDKPPAPYAAKGLAAPVGAVAVGQEAPAGAVREVTVARLDAPPDRPAARPSGPDRKAAPEIAAAPASGRVHKVTAGDSLRSLAQTYGVSQDALVRANALDGGIIRPGQVLTIPDGAPAQPVQVAAVQPKAQVVSDAPALAAPAPLEEKAAEPAPAVKKAAPAAEPASQEPAQAADSGPGFRWPVRGKVIAGFGKKSNGERNDGINLAVPEGTSVKAAEDGEVIYAGNELKSYGNLVLIRHSNGFVSAYAHNKSLEVKRGEKIRRGQVIAKSGMSGGVSTPQVHFELRRGATPVNPLDHLSDG